MHLYQMHYHAVSLFDQEYSKTFYIVKYYHLKWLFCCVLIRVKVSFIPVINQIWIFSIIAPVFSVTWSFRNHSDLLLKKHFLQLSVLKTVVQCFIFLWKLWYIYIYIYICVWGGGESLINTINMNFECSKEQRLF